MICITRRPHTHANYLFLRWLRSTNLSLAQQKRKSDREPVTGLTSPKPVELIGLTSVQPFVLSRFAPLLAWDSTVAPREALLRPEYREWFPGLVPGIWYHAAWLAEIVREQQERGAPRWAIEGRLPCDEHFAFRGGRARSPTQRTRRTDVADATSHESGG